MIQLIELTKRFNRIWAVAGISLDVRPGEVFGFLGPNGAGKTTTIKMMAGILRPTSGRVIINGLDLAGHPEEAKAQIGFIPDRPFLYEKLTGTEFLRFISGLYQVPESRAMSRITRLLALFELDGWENELIENYSHGMKQRLVMSAALIHEPKMLVVDEPMVGLDPRGARLVKNIFRHLVSEGGSVFMSTHTLEIAQQVCDRVAIIDHGRIIALGTPDELRDLSGLHDSNLESVFLRLTGGEDIADVLEYLKPTN
ncbi:MAG: ABC transporter ATP-binding protein [Deltaproteobacteria bacterium]|nr:ABC transporter ATP-binding protein [Deltaproteobacteria bacterium]